jgi:hypothetical protein
MLTFCGSHLDTVEIAVSHGKALIFFFEALLLSISSNRSRRGAESNDAMRIVVAVELLIADR